MRHLTLFAMLCIPLHLAAAQPYWNQFRGPNGDGVSEANDLPVRWTETENVAWKTPIHGLAWSSPVVWEDEIWMTTATEDGHKLSAVCIELKSGKIIHDILIFEVAEPQYRHPTNTHASSTPIIEEGRIYLHYGSHGTACLDTTSQKKLWERRDLPCNHWRGAGSSPIVHDDLLIVAYDGYDFQYVVALDKNTGETVWNKDRNIDYGTDNGDAMKAYSTATVIEANGRQELISPSAMSTIAYNPATGDEFWRVNHGGMNAAIRPLFSNGLIYVCAGDGPEALVAIKPGGNGDVTNSHVEWRTGKSTPKRPSQIVFKDLFFMIEDEGVASCLDANTGELIWKKRVGGKHWASPIYANGRIYCFSKDGKAVVFAAQREFELLAENEFEEGVWAAPAVAGNALLVRSKNHLYCLKK